MKEIFLSLITSGKFFNVTFRKKNGDIRELNGRFGVTEHITTEAGKVDPCFLRGDNVIVWDNMKKAYRTIPLMSILKLSAGGLVVTREEK